MDFEQRNKYQFTDISTGQSCFLTMKGNDGWMDVEPNRPIDSLKATKLFMTSAEEDKDFFDKLNKSYSKNEKIIKMAFIPREIIGIYKFKEGGGFLLVDSAYTTEFDQRGFEKGKFETPSFRVLGDQGMPDIKISDNRWLVLSSNRGPYVYKKQGENRRDFELIDKTPQPREWQERIREFERLKLKFNNDAEINEFKPDPNPPSPCKDILGGKLSR
jgi:hypothetical protein